MTGAAVQERLSTVELLAERGIYPAREQPHRPRDAFLYLCPLPGHADTDPSFSVHQDGNKWNCFPCGQSGGPAALLTLLAGPDIPTPVRQPKVAKKGGGGHGPNTWEGATVASLALAKGLDPNRLKEELGWRDTLYPGSQTPVLQMPYPDENNEDPLLRYRVGITDPDRFRWGRFKNGQRQRLYGLWLLDWIRTQGRVLLVEGETDFATCYFNGIPVLGAPGSSSWNSSWSRYFEGLEVYVWQEPDRGGDTLVEKVTQDLPWARIVKAPPGIKDPNDMFQQCGDGEGFAQWMHELFIEALPAQPEPTISSDRPVDAEIETYLSTREQVFKKGWRGVWKTLASMKEVLLKEMPRQTDAEAKRWRNFSDCGEKYNGKKCRHLGERYYVPYHCQDPSVCAFCARANSEQFWRSKSDQIADVGQLSLWVVQVGSYWLPDDPVERVKAMNRQGKLLSKFVQQLTDNWKGQSNLAVNHFRGVQTDIRGDLVTHQIVFDGLPEEGAEAMLKAHFKERTGVEPLVRVIGDLDPEGFREQFVELTSIRCQWDTATNFLQWREAFKHFHLVQAKGSFKNLAGSKAPMPPKAERERKKSISCLVCGDCEPIEQGMVLIAETPTVEVKSPWTGKTYLAVPDA